MNDLYYQKLKTLLDNGRLKTYIIIAPPRSNSSLVEHSLGNSPDIEYECHEPFLNARHENFDPDHGYKQIYESIGGEQFAQSDSQTSVVVKEMSHWIGKNEEYKRLATLSTKPIIFLIRNPLLTVESRLRRVLKTIDMRYNIDLQRHLLDEIAVERGFQGWNDLAEMIKQQIGKEIKINLGKNRTGEVVKFVADISSAKKTLGYSPKVSLEEGVKKSIEWYKKLLKEGVEI